MSEPGLCLAAPPDDRAARVHDALDAAGLTLYRAAALTAASRAGAVTHTLYRDVRAGRVPSMAQLAALSRVTRTPLAWWLALFGVDLATLTPLQIALHTTRTIPLPARDVGALLDVTRWSRLASNANRITRWIDLPDEPQATRRPRRDRHVYLSLAAHPRFLPLELAGGSIVRVDTRHRVPGRFGPRAAIYAVAHAQGLCCCYVDALSATHVALFGASHEPPVVCRLDDDAIVLGRVDAELRMLQASASDAEPPLAGTRPGEPVVLPDAQRDPFGRFLQRSRRLLDLTFRDARLLADAVADACGDERFQLSIGALCNYETLDEPPASPHALFTLAAIYAFDLETLLPQAASRTNDESPLMPDRVARTIGVTAAPESIYLRGPAQKRLDLRLTGAIAFTVDDRDRRFVTDPGVEAPLRLLRVASEALVCCAASLVDDTVLVHPAPALGLGARRLPREHVEVLGRVTAVLRRPVR